MNKESIPSKNRIMPLLIAVIAALIVIAAVSAMNQNGSANDDLAQQATPEVVTHEDREPVPVAKPTEPRTAFGDGVWEVGVDIKPGKYKGTTEDSCYYARLSNLSGDDNIIDNNNVEGPITIEILSTDVAFESDGCSWKIVE